MKLRLKLNNKTRAICGPLFLLLFVAQLSSAQNEADTANSLDPKTVTDGPYISFEDDTTLAVSHVCFGEHHHQAVGLDSTAAIPDCCFPTLPGGLTVSRKPFNSPLDRVEHASQVLAISDIHGEFEAMISFLTNAQVIDSGLNWQWNDGHLVIVGDVFDRGDMVIRSLWFLYRLQRQAAEANGAVHLLLGNHELMVMRGDERYLNEKYTEVTVPTIGQSHVELVGQNTIIGQWLRTRPVMIVIDSVLFAHGGPSLTFAKSSQSVLAINMIAQNSIDLPKDSVKADSLASLMYGSLGPFWYRGLLIEYKGPQVTSPQLDSVLTFFDARAIVVGHTEVDSIVSHFDGRLFGVDVPVPELGGLQGWLLRDKVFYRVTTAGELEELGDWND